MARISTYVELFASDLFGGLANSRDWSRLRTFSQIWISSIGKHSTPLLERDGKKPGQRIGKSPWLQSVHVETDSPIGSLVEVELVSAGPNSLGGVQAAMRG